MRRLSERADIRVIQCNYAVGTKACAEGARAYVWLTNPGGGNDRIQVVARSRGGRFVERWEDIRHLRDFRLRTMPPEHPVYRRLASISWDEETVAILNQMREYWSTHTQSGAPKSPPVAAP